MAKRPDRPCLACGASDDHPRHQVALPDGSSVFYHPDCHSHAGCESCADLVKDAGGKTGNALLAHLTKEN